MKHSSDHRTALAIILLGAILFGSFLRISFTLKEAFPRNDGGLFWAMTQDLIDNQFNLPAFTSYNQAKIPFAYPPGAFYTVALLHKILKISLVDLFRFIPLFFSILLLFFVYPIARLVLYSQRQAILATYAFALIQPAYAWPLMGGGITRSPALFFSTLAILGTLKYVRGTMKPGWMFISIACISLTAYFHIEIAWITAVILIFLALIYRRTWRMVSYLAAHGMAGAILLAPYWTQIIAHHGIQPFVNALSSGYAQPLISIAMLFVPLFTAEKIFQVLAVLAVLGVFACIATKQYVPILWLILVTLISPRSVHRSAALPEALLIATSLDVFLIQGLNSVQVTKRLGAQGRSLAENGFLPALKPLKNYSFAAILLVYALFLAVIQQALSLETPGLSRDERSSFSWVKEQTKNDATFLILPANPSWTADWVSEWFPALTGRQSLLTVQGYEWKSSGYQQKIDTYEELTGCIKSGRDCFETWKTKHHLAYDYVMVPKRSDYYAPVLLQGMGIFNGCQPTYQNQDVEIYHCMPQKE